MGHKRKKSRFTNKYPVRCCDPDAWSGLNKNHKITSLVPQGSGPDAVGWSFEGSGAVPQGWLRTKFSHAKWARSDPEPSFLELSGFEVAFSQETCTPVWCFEGLRKLWAWVWFFFSQASVQIYMPPIYDYKSRNWVLVSEPGFLKVFAHFPWNFILLPEMKPRNNIVY